MVDNDHFLDMFSPYSHSGFYNSPVSKGFLGTVVVTSFALHVPFHNYRPYFIYSHSHIFQQLQLWRLVTAKLPFLDTKDLICGALLIYYFRIFERRYGSQKFASYLLATCTLSTCLELMTSSACSYFDINVNILPSGPYGMVMALFVPYYCDIPRVAITHFLGVPVTGKSFMYILGLQICTSSLESLIVAVCGLLSGVLYRMNVFYVKNWLCIPCAVANFCHKTIGRLLQSPSPDLVLPMGATLELQRLQQMERVEAQLAWQAAREYRDGQHNHRIHQEFNPNMPDFQEPVHQNAHHVMTNHDDRRQHYRGAPMASTSRSQESFVSEQQIERLVEMGFARDSALQALRSSHNDLNSAMNILLQESL